MNTSLVVMSLSNSFSSALASAAATTAVVSPPRTRTSAPLRDAASAAFWAARFREKYGLVGKKVILYLSILHQFKRPDKLIRVLPRLIENEPNVFLLYAGPDAGELEGIRELGKSLGVTEHYKWLGPLQGDEKHEAFECCEFLALPSDEDPYPLVLLEAMAHRKPVLTTSVVGQASVIRAHEAGIIVSPGDQDALVDEAARLLTDDRYRQAIGANARRLAERMFSVGKVVDEIESLYADLIERKGAAARSSG